MISYQKRKRKKRWHKWFLGKYEKEKKYDINDFGGNWYGNE